MYQVKIILKAQIIQLDKKYYVKSFKVAEFFKDVIDERKFNDTQSLLPKDLANM